MEFINHQYEYYRELIENSSHRQRIERIEAMMHGKVAGVNFKKLIDEVNCCGCLAYVIDRVSDFREHAFQRDCGEFLKLPNQIDAFPDYIPPRAGLRFIRENCKEVSEKALSSGDLVLYLDRMYWSHGGVYLGEMKNGKRIMFHKDGVGNDFQFNDVGAYWPLDGANDRSFWRIRV